MASPIEKLREIDAQIIQRIIECGKMWAIREKLAENLAGCANLKTYQAGLPKWFMDPESKCIKLHKIDLPAPQFKPLDRVKIYSCGMVLDGRVMAVNWTRAGLAYLCEFTTSGYFYERYFLAGELKLADNEAVK